MGAAGCPAHSKGKLSKQIKLGNPTDEGAPKNEDLLESSITALRPIATEANNSAEIDSQYCTNRGINDCCEAGNNRPAAKLVSEGQYQL